MEYKEPIQITDPEVTRKKFSDEVTKFRAVENKYRAKGMLCLEVNFPSVYFLFSIPKLVPYPIVFSTRINFTNYDVEPPSIVFINPFTRELLRREQIPIHFIQMNSNNPLQPQELLQGSGDMIPFFCIPGVKEYHDHPAHSGDPWFLYRTKGEGTLLFILDQLYNYSIPSAKGFLVNANIPMVRINQEIILPQQNLIVK